jgi:arylesterase/paraoxonase
MRKRLGWIGLALTLVIATLVFDSLRRAGELETLVAKPLACDAVSGVIGPEDITVDRRRGIAYLSSNDSRAAMQGRTVPGALYSYAPGERRLTRLFSAEDFHPHGISLLLGQQDPDLLYVVNHPTETTHRIEVFEVDGDSAHHVESLTDPLLSSPNDVLAISRGEL